MGLIKFHRNLVFPKFRKKPEVIEAIQWTGENEDSIQSFCPSAFHTRLDLWAIPSTNGTLKLDIGDWVVKDSFGVFHVLAESSFNLMYEQMTGDDD